MSIDAILTSKLVLTASKTSFYFFVFPTFISSAFSPVSGNGNANTFSNSPNASPGNNNTSDVSRTWSSTTFIPIPIVAPQADISVDGSGLSRGASTNNDIPMASPPTEFVKKVEVSYKNKISKQ